MKIIPFCQDNLTYAVTNIDLKPILAIENRNRLVGFAGRTIDELLAKRHLRTCNIIGESLLGIKLDNGSYTGNLGLLQRKEANVYLKLEPPLVNDENWLKLSNPIITANFLIIQEISNFKKSVEFDLIENLYFEKILSVSFLTFTFLSIIIISFLVKIRYYNIFNSNRFNLKKLFLISTNLKKSISYTVSALSIFLTFYHIYIWLSQLLITNNISTNQVIIDSSSIIKNQEDCFTTKRTFCILEDDTESRIIALAGKDNFLRKLFDLKGKIKYPIKGMENKINCIIEKSEKSIEINLDEIFSIVSEQVGYVAAYFVAGLKSNLIGWMNKEPIFTMNLHVYHSYSEDWVKNSVYIYTETGLFLNTVQTLRKDAILQFQKTNKAFFSLKELKDDYYSISDLKIQNFKNIFKFYFAICLFVFLIFLINCALNLIRKKIKYLIRKIKLVKLF